MSPDPQSYSEATKKHMKFATDELGEYLQDFSDDLDPEQVGLMTFNNLNATTIALSNLAVAEKIEKIVECIERGK